MLSIATLPAHSLSLQHLFENRHVVWTPPESGCFKINADANFNQFSSIARAGVVVRDSSAILLGGCGKAFYSLSPTAIEDFVVHIAIQFVIRRNFLPCMIESNSKVVVQLCSSHNPPPWELKALIHDLRLLFFSRSFNFGFFCP